MGVVPLHGRAYSLAFYNVLSNIVVGLAPLVWGPVLDYLDPWRLKWRVWQWNSYSLFYSVLTMIMAVSLFMLRSVAEPQAMTWNAFAKELLVTGPLRSISFLIRKIQ